MLKIIIFSMSFLFLMTGEIFPQITLGADVVSRYVWRGTDFGNSVSVQPALSLAIDKIEIGAWGSYPLTATAAGAGANENDLYATLRAGPVSFTLTDYYFPETMNFFDYSDKDGFHILEISAATSIKNFSFMGTVNVSGDANNSIYAEMGYAAYEKDGYTVNLMAGAGNYVYIHDPSGDFNWVNLGLTASKGSLFTSFILNPELETDFFVFGYSF